MTPVLNDGQSHVEPPATDACEPTSTNQWPAASEQTDLESPTTVYQQDIALPTAEHSSAKFSTEAVQATHTELSPPPIGSIDSDVKEKDTMDTAMLSPPLTPAQASEDWWASSFRIPGILPPPERPQFSSSFLRPGSRFTGRQQSDKQIYNVEVTFKSVDIRNSSLCGYLRIEGLTKDHPTLTTYFEGEIIGTKYTFQTKHEKWGATEKTDMQHWHRFPAWRPLASQAKRADFNYKNFMEKENVFMRWKEYFLVPDHHVREIQGASFEGFYYICFNQVKGTVSGIYFHSKSEKYQQLDLEHVPDMSGFAAVEFR